MAKSTIYTVTAASVNLKCYNSLKSMMYYLRPQSVDSWDGGPTDELKKTVMEKKIGKNFEKF